MGLVVMRASEHCKHTSRIDQRKELSNQRYSKEDYIYDTACLLQGQRRSDKEHIKVLWPSLSALCGCCFQHMDSNDSMRRRIYV